MRRRAGSPGGHCRPGGGEPAVRSRVEEMQITMNLGGPDVQRRFLAEQMKLWGAVIKDNNIKASG